jgi:dihydrolipoamide dehydrogenase
MSDKQAQVIIIGAGPAGYVCAIRAAQLGMKVIVVDKNPHLGGTCLNVGCIPSKALLHSTHLYWDAKNHFEKHGIYADNLRLDIKKMMARKDAILDELTRGIGHLFRKNNIQLAFGHATIIGPGHIEVVNEGKTQELKADHIVVATGSVPHIPSIDGLVVDEKRILSSTGALSLDRTPKHLVVMGAGYIGLELGSVWMRLGATVTVVEYAPKALASMDADVSESIQKTLESQGMNFRFQKKVTKIHQNDKHVTLTLMPADGTPTKDDLPDILQCDTLLVATGRKPAVDSLGLANVGVSLNEQGQVCVNHRYETTCPGIYAIGDSISGPMLAHKAMEEGVALAEILAGQAGGVNYRVIPAVMYTHPEAASVGKTEEEVKASQTPYKVGKFPFSINSRAKTIGDTAGFVKIISHEKTDQILGVHVVGEDAGTLIAEAAMAMEFGASSEDIARTCHAHPTLSEAMKEAAFGTFSRPLHS